MAKDKKTTLLEALIKNPGEATAKADELKKFGFDAAQVAASVKVAKGILDDPDGADRVKEFATLAFPVKLALLEMLSEEGAGAVLARLQKEEKDKAVGKAIAKAIHGVRSQGQNVADIREKKTIKFDFGASEGAPDSFVSALDTEGNRLVLLSRLTPAGRLNVFHVVVGDTMGLQNFEGMALTRAAYRKFIGMAESQMGAKLAPIGSDYASWMIQDAAKRSVKSGLPTPPAFEQARSMIEAPESEPNHPLEALLDRKEVEKSASSLVEKSGAIHTWPECAFWVPDEAALEKLSERVKEADESKVATSEKQKTELKEEAAKKTLVEYFDDSKRTLWENRLRETAYVLAATGRPDDAKVAWATGITLGKKGSDVEKIPFAKDLVFKILRAADHDHAGHDHSEHDHAHGPSAEMRAQSEGPAGKT